MVLARLGSIGNAGVEAAAGGRLRHVGRLRPAELRSADSDLQLVAVRFVDPGHPEEKLGPRYRVWFRNNGSQPIAQPFNVMLFAGNDERLAEGMAQAGVRVTAMEPAEDPKRRYPSAGRGLCDGA